MKKRIKMILNTKILMSNEEALKNVIDLFKELEEKGYIQEGEIVFDSSEEEIITSIFDNHIKL